MEAEKMRQAIIQKAEQEAAEAHEYAAQTFSELEEAAHVGVGEEVRSDIEAGALDVMELADRAARRLAEAQAKMEEAAKKAEAVGVSPEEEIRDVKEEETGEAERDEESGDP